MTERQIPMPSSQRFLGILTRKERWGLSWRGWLAVVLVAMLAGWGCLVSVYPFLAVTHRVDAEVLVVEGWVHDCAIFPATEEFKTGRYLHIFTTGGPVEGDGRYTNDPNTSASAGADRLKKIGVPNDSLQMVPSRVMSRDRTYSSAVALRDWLHEHQISVRSINIVTEDVHARRTRLLFQKALGDQVTVGIIAVPSPDFETKRWWRYSEGVREVIGESIADLYAKLLFIPAK